MKKILEKAHLRFVKHFGYLPEFPPDMDFDEEEYAGELDKCVNENLDYTITKYGTMPPKEQGLPEIIVD